MMSSFFFSTPVDIDIILDGSDERETVDVKLDKGRREKVPLYMDGESVKGAVTVRPKDGKRLEHTGIKVQFIGTIGMGLDSSVLLLPSFSLPWRNPSAKTVYPLTSIGLTMAFCQRCSSTAATTTNSSPSSRSSRPPASCSTRRPFPSTSRTSRSSTNPTTAST